MRGKAIVVMGDRDSETASNQQRQYSLFGLSIVNIEAANDSTNEFSGAQIKNIVGNSPRQLRECSLETYLSRSTVNALQTLNMQSA